MIDRVGVDSKIRAWLKRVPLSAIMILLKAVHDELKSRKRAHAAPIALSGDPGRPLCCLLPCRDPDDGRAVSSRAKTVDGGLNPLLRPAERSG